MKLRVVAGVLVVAAMSACGSNIDVQSSASVGSSASSGVATSSAVATSSTGGSASSAVVTATSDAVTTGVGGGASSSISSSSGLGGAPYMGSGEVSFNASDGYVEVLANFSPDYPPNNGCTDEPFGDCVIESCPEVGSPPPEDSAGTVTVAVGAVSITATPDDGDLYQASMNAASPWGASGGEMIDFTVAGDVAPAAQAMISAPGLGVVSAPAIPDDMLTPMTISTANDLTVSWTGGGSGAFVEVLLEGDDVWKKTICKFDATAGTGVVPTAAMSWLAGSPDGSILILHESETTATVQGWDYTFSAYSFDTTPDGSDAINDVVSFE